MTRHISLIVIHCSASPEGRDLSVKDIDAMHRQRGFAKVGYHYVIRLDGTVEKGRDEAEIGAHVQGYNANSTGICYIGGVEKDGQKAKDTRTDAQKDALESLVRSLKQRWPNARLCGHRDLSPDLNHDGKIEPNEWMKQCPSFDVTKWWMGLNA